MVLTWVFFGIVMVAFGATEWRLRSAGVLAPDTGASIARSYQPEAVVPLVRRAARRIVASPLLWLGVVAAVILAVAEGRPAYPRALIGGWTVPADIGLFAAVYLVAGRGQAPAASSTPDQRTRTAALLLGATPVACALGLVSLVVVAVLMGPLDVFDGWLAHPLEFAQAVAVPLVMATVAVAAARWWPHPAVAPVVLIVLLFSPLSWQLDLYQVTGRGGWVPTDPSSLATGELAWHLTYLLGFAVFASGLALLRHDRRLPPVALTAAGAFFLALGQLAPGV